MFHGHVTALSMSVMAALFVSLAACWLAAAAAVRAMRPGVARFIGVLVLGWGACTATTAGAAGPAWGAVVGSSLAAAWFVLVPEWAFRAKAGYWSFSVAREIGAEAHAARVAGVAAAVAASASGAPARLCTGDRSAPISMQARAYKASCESIHVSLGEVVSYDARSRVLVVEPRCDVMRIGAFLARRGAALPVAPETDFLTIGGLVMGSGIGSSSCVHGLVADACVAFELVLGDGSTRTVRRGEDAFLGVPFSHGCACFLVGVHVQCVPAAPYVLLSLTPAHSHEAAMADLLRASRAAADAAAHSDMHSPAGSAAGTGAPQFVEAIVFSPALSVLITGAFVGAPPRGVPLFASRWWSPFYHNRVRAMVAAGGATLCMPTTAYLFRCAIG